MGYMLVLLFMETTTSRRVVHVQIVAEVSKDGGHPLYPTSTMIFFYVEPTLVSWKLPDGVAGDMLSRLFEARSPRESCAMRIGMMDPIHRKLQSHLLRLHRQLEYLCQVVVVDLAEAPVPVWRIILMSCC